MSVMVNDQSSGKRMSIMEVTSQANSNMHENFCDLNELERKKKEQLANQLAGEWMNKLGLHVATKYEGSVQNVERNKFKKQIYDGKRISINSL